MTIKISSVEVQKTKETKNGEPVLSATLHCATQVTFFQIIYLFTKSGQFLFKRGMPIVKFRDYDVQLDRKYRIGETNYQARLYNRIIEQIPPLYPAVVQYLLQKEFIDKASLIAKDSRLYNIAIKNPDPII